MAEVIGEFGAGSISALRHFRFFHISGAFLILGLEASKDTGRGQVAEHLGHSVGCANGFHHVGIQLKL